MPDSTPTSDSVLVEIAEPHIWIFTLNRPDARNAVNREMADAMAKQLQHFSEDPAARVGILTGANKGFCAGLDLKAFVESGDLGETPDGGFCGFARRGPRKPLIAAVEGHALAGGLEVALACDLLVVADDARLGVPEVRRGLVADGGALLRLPRDLPYRIAMEMALTGREIPATRLHDLGLINYLCRPGESLEVALTLGKHIAANAPLAVEASKMILSSREYWDDEQQWTQQQRIAAPVWASRDAQEGATAFAQRRPPVFEGR